jgi:hypothetical protein
MNWIIHGYKSIIMVKLNDLCVGRYDKNGFAWVS